MSTCVWVSAWNSLQIFQCQRLFSFPLIFLTRYSYYPASDIRLYGYLNKWRLKQQQSCRGASSNSSKPLWTLEPASQYCFKWSHRNDLWAFWRPQYLSAHPSAFAIRLWQHNSNGVAFLFWRSLTSLKWQRKARGLCVIQGQYQFDTCFPWRSITVIFCFPLRLCDSIAQLCSGRWEVMNAAQAQAGEKWWMATITLDH